MTECSIIVPTFNRPDRLQECLEALVAQQGVDFEIIVVDDGSKQSMEPICQEFGPLVRCIRQENSGPAQARNAGADHARGTFLAFTDDDCRPKPDWLAQLRAAHAGETNRMVGGKVVNGLPQNVYSSASQALCDFLYEWFDATEGNMPFFTSNNLAISREGFNRLGGFDTTFERAAAEDRDFGICWRELGGELVYTGNAIVDHFHHLSLSKFWRQHANYGAGAAHLHKKMQAREVPKPRFERMAFYWGLLSFPSRREGRLRLDLIALMFLSQAAMVAGYFSRRNGR